MESKKEIVNLGYPEVVAKLFYEKFGNLAFLMAKWFREYKYPPEEKPANWWLQTMGNWRENPSLWDLTYLYDATKDRDYYNKALEKLEKPKDEFVDLDAQRSALETRIKNKLFADGFFHHNALVQNIMTGVIKDLAPYKKLNFQQAQDRYDKQNIFKNKTPLKTYANGYKWIDVGMHCQLVGHLMKNCGSAGLMSWDEGRTLLVLFDSRNKPHAVVTYSPNEKRISGDEGIGSSELKDKYHEYILDLAKVLNVSFDTSKTKSNYLKVKYLLSGVAQNLEKLPGSNTYDSYYRFLANGKEYFTNSYVVVSKEDVEKMLSMINRGEVGLHNDQKNPVKNVFNHMNQPILARHGINYVLLNKFIGKP